MKNIVLIGMMGCGKSTCAAILSRRLGLSAVDTDGLIVEREGRSIPDIFAAEGEGYFRDRELEVAKELAGQQDLIIACGGGLPLRPDCIGPLKDSGTVVFLNRDPGEIYDSVSMAGRPLGQGGRGDFLARFAQREPIYRKWADHVVNSLSTPAATVDAILAALDL